MAFLHIQRQRCMNRNIPPHINANNLSNSFFFHDHICRCVVCVFGACVRVISFACLSTILACVLRCGCLDTLHPPDLDPPPSSSACPSQLPLQGAVERPQTTLPIASPSPTLVPLGCWPVAARGPGRVESMGDRASVAGPSCSTLTASEGMDMQRLLRTQRRQQGMLGSFCSRVVSSLRRLSFNMWSD